MSTSVLDVYKIRKKFPILQKKINGSPFIYLDTAATSQKPEEVVRVMNDFYLKRYATVHRGVYDLSMEATDLYEGARGKIASFIKAKSEGEIVFTKGATEAINLVALSFGSLLQEGDEVVLTEGEHHSNLLPWQFLAKRKKVHLRVIPITLKGEIDLLQYEKALGPRTKLVSVAHVFNSIGTVNPISSMIRSAHKWGAKVLIDGAQSISHMPIDVQDLEADFFVFSAHKAYGPNGMGVLYGKSALLEEMPPVFGGGDMVEKVSVEEATFQKPPFRFEAGTPAIAEVLGFAEVVDFLQKIGLSEIEAYETTLTEYALERLKEIEEVTILSKANQLSSIVGFVVEGVHPLDLGTFLDLQGIAIRTGNHCAQPMLHRLGVSSSARVSFGIYNTVEEIDIFIQALKDIIPHLKRTGSF